MKEPEGTDVPLAFLPGCSATHCIGLSFLLQFIEQRRHQITARPLRPAKPKVITTDISCHIVFSSLTTPPAVNMLRNSATKTVRSSTSLLSTTTRRAQPQCLSIASQQQSRQQHAVSNPTLSNIEKRWEQMPPQEQAELWMALRDRMTVDWKELTTQEKKACEYSFLSGSPRKAT